MLARIQGIVGPFPRWMLTEGDEAGKYFTPEGCVYQRMDDDSCECVDDIKSAAVFGCVCRGAWGGVLVLF